MVDLYISYNVLIDCLIQQDESNPLWDIINSGIVDLFVDIDISVLDRFMDSPRHQDNQTDEFAKFSMLYDLLQDKDLPVFSGKERMDIVKNNGNYNDKYKDTPSSAIFIYEKIKDKDASYIQKKYGVICLSSENLSLLSSIRKERKGYSHYWDCDGDETGSWKFIINSLPEVPCNSIIFCDHYLYRDDKKLNNISDLIETFLLNRNKPECIIHILFIWEDHFNNNNAAKKVCDKIYEILDGAKVMIEFIFCSNSNHMFKLYMDTHNRKILTNFSLASAEHSLAAFSKYDGKPLKNQRLTYDLAFSNEIVHEQSCIIKTIAKDIKFAIDELKKKKNDSDKKDVELDKIVTYKYLVSSSENNEVKEEDIKKLKNRLIMNTVELRDGDKCYYLSVPNQNDWTNIKWIDGIYNEDHYKECIVSKEAKPLEDLAKKIKDIFTQKQYKQASDNTSPFYRVTVSKASDIKTVHVLESISNESVEDQKKYKYNCFKRKEDAEEVVYNIKWLLNIYCDKN